MEMILYSCCVNSESVLLIIRLPIISLEKNIVHLQESLQSLQSTTSGATSHMLKTRTFFSDLSRAPHFGS